MRNYIIRRLLIMIPTLLIVSFLIFFTVALIPGNMIDTMSAADPIGQGRLMPGDGATYHSVAYRVLVFKPIRGEIVEGNVVELMDFGAFIRMGPLDGLCHVSQICDDFITQDSKGNALLGKETGRTLAEGDKVRARITSISFESGNRSGKLGLTMRQPFLGKIGPQHSWVEDDVRSARGEKPKKEKKKM